MKCSICGKEFGKGVNCQNCGVDRVTGLANYSSYGTSDYQGANTSHYDLSYNSSPKTMVCYSCGEIIPANSEYCPHCRKKLFETCPKCGHKYSSQYLNCNQCGTNLKQYLKEEKERERKRTEEAIKVQLKEQYQKEAQSLRDNLTLSKTNFMTVALTAWILFCLTPLYPFSGYGSLLLIIGVSILLWVIVYMISESITNSRIDKWKQEHPNDPRSKYL